MMIIKSEKDVSNNVVRDIVKIMDRYGPTEQLSNVINVLEMDKKISQIWIDPAYTFKENDPDYIDATLVTEDNKLYLEGYRGYIMG
ncbi:hypothetical protein [Paenibacillus sp. NPDC057934]|uniref:hypothetical protein n=1 Tax=Paenibacillus sp. NPDC057934 TaxID=3346282 RepID=UPI0036D8BD62